jgi:hypothetical protein
MPDTILPPQSDELILPDGTVIKADGSRKLDPAVNAVVEVENAAGAVALVTKMKRNLGDLPDVPANMNGIACVLTYTSIGLSDADIATALSTTEDNITKLKESDLYKQIEGMFDERVFDDEMRTARHILSKHAANAANKMVTLVNAPSGDLALAASRDVLRISGVDKSQESKGMTALKIIMVDDNDTKKTQIEVKLG